MCIMMGTKCQLHQNINGFSNEIFAETEKEEVELNAERSVQTCMDGCMLYGMVRCMV